MEHIRYLKFCFHQQVECYGESGTVPYMAPEIFEDECYGMVSVHTLTLRNSDLIILCD
jgi:hypothetical protein